MNIIVVLVVAVALYFMWRYTETERKKQERYEKALKIAKHFGDRDLTLFRFYKTRDKSLGRVWVIIAFDVYSDDPDDLPEHPDYFVIADYYGDDKKEIDQLDLEVRALLRILPYRIEICDAYIPFDEYQQRRSEYVQRQILGDT